MMVTWVRGLFTDVHGWLDLEWDRCVEATFEGAIDAAGIWTGEPQRDEHLRSADFLDAENHPKITVAGRFTERTGSTTFKGEVDLTIRGVTRTVPLDKSRWGSGRRRSGSVRRTRASCFESVSKAVPRSTATTSAFPGRTRSRAGGVVVGNEIELNLDVEAILLDELERTGAIEYYRR